MEEEKEVGFFKKLWDLINKNKRNQGIAWIIGSILGAYLSVIMIFITLKVQGLASGLLAVTDLILIIASISSLVAGWSRLDDYNSGW